MNRLRTGAIVVYNKETNGLYNFSLGDKFVVAGTINDMDGNPTIVQLYENKFGDNYFYYLSKDLIDENFELTSEKIAEDIMDKMCRALGIKRIKKSDMIHVHKTAGGQDEVLTVEQFIKKWSGAWNAAKEKARSLMNELSELNELSDSRECGFSQVCGDRDCDNCHPMDMGYDSHTFGAC